MSDNHEVVISELRSDRNQAIQELADLRAKHETLQAQVSIVSELTELLDTQDVFKVVSEMKKQLDTWRPLVTGVQALGDKPLETIQEMQSTIAELQQATLVHTIVDAINERVKFEGARPMIAEMMGIVRNDDNIAEMTRSFADAKSALTHLDSILERESVQEMLKSMVYKATGGKATSTRQYGADWRDSFIEAGKRKADAITGGSR